MIKAYLKTTLLLCLWACFGISLHITAAQAAQEEVKEDAYVPKRTQLLTIFLDNYEAREHLVRFVKSKLYGAISHKAGPIIVSSSLFYNIAIQSGQISLFLKDWIIHEVAEHVLIMIPKSYLEKNKLSVESLGLKMPEQSSIIPGIIKQRYESYSQNDWKDLIKNTGAPFVNALLQGAIFDQTNKEIEWVIYLSGHGFYNQSIAGISLKDFPKMLDFFDKKISVALFVYISCYAAGLNAAKIYKDQAKSGLEGEKEYLFPIATQAVGDLEVASEEDLREQFFTEFIDTFIKDSYAYENFLPFIMPSRGKVIARESKGVGNLPQIRLAHAPIWLPIASLKKETVHITKTMAATREKPLLIKEVIKTILLDSDYIPFEIDIDRKSPPYFIITAPGNVMIYITKMVLPWGNVSLQKLSDSMYHDYAGDKKIYIEKLVIQNENAPAITYTDVLLDFNDPMIYYTEAKTGMQMGHLAKERENPNFNDIAYTNQIALAQQLKELRLQQRRTFKNVQQNVAEKALATQSIADLLSEKNKILLHAEQQLDIVSQDKNFPEKHRQKIQRYINTLEEGLDTSNPRIMQQQIKELSDLIEQEFKLGKQEAQKQK
ncbi:MAG TPA: hypothetical protein VGT41_04090 [Candidatus Babeliales bacterium]|nr:hypothetical protein [Candidatus Babeliales bacterium]